MRILPSYSSTSAGKVSPELDSPNFDREGFPLPRQVWTTRQLYRMIDKRRRSHGARNLLSPGFQSPRLILTGRSQ
jgi:hypothetical protein